LSAADFVARFKGLADADSLFVPSSKLLPMGSRRRLVIELKTGDVVMQFQGEVSELQPEKTARARKGMRFRILHADPSTQELHKQLLPSGQVRPAAPPPDCALYEEATEQLGLETLARASSAAATDAAKSNLDAILDAGAFSQPVPLIPAPTRWTRAMTVVAVGAGGLGLLLGYLIWGRTPRMAQAEHVPAAAAAPAPSPRSAPPPPAPPPAPESPSPVAAAAAAKPAPASGCLATIESAPRGATVTWDGRSLGETPLSEVAVPCGRATVVLKRQHYKRVERAVDASPGASVRVSERLARSTAARAHLEPIGPPHATRAPAAGTRRY